VGGAHRRDATIRRPEVMIAAFADAVMAAGPEGQPALIGRA
jgi:hypothetical protein